MAMKNPLLRWRGESKHRRMRRARHHALRNFARKPPLVRGLARTVDVGGLLRDADVESALRARREIAEALKRSGLDVVVIGEDWDTVGRDFQSVVGPAVGKVASTEAGHERIRYVY